MVFLGSSQGFPTVFQGLKVKSHSFYTGGRAFWELPKDLQEDYAEADPGRPAGARRKTWVFSMGKPWENHGKTMGLTMGNGNLS